MVEIQADIDAVLPGELDEDEAYLQLQNSANADIRAVLKKSAMDQYETKQRVALAAE